MKILKIKSFCKINLSLKIIKKLNNGYHSIKSLITFCKIYDIISIGPIQGPKDKITFSGKFKKGISVKSNTITKTLYLLRKKKLILNNVFKIDIQKNIPHGSGLGGGSTNAASLLNFLNLKMNLKLKKKELIKIGNRVGFDVPICLENKNIFLTGKKNEIKKINKRFNFNILVVYPNIICSTGKIYKNNKIRNLAELGTDFNIQTKGKLIEYIKKQGNDLEKTVVRLYPKIKKIIDFIEIQNGCYFSSITGSGSACIGIFLDNRSAIYAKNLIKLKFPKYWSVVSKTI